VLDHCAVLDNTGHFGTRGSVQSSFDPWGEIHLVGGTLASVATDWGTFGTDATPDVGLQLTGEPVYEYVGTQSFTCDDTARTGCQ
jgi:hypothetical protein